MALAESGGWVGIGLTQVFQEVSHSGEIEAETSLLCSESHLFDSDRFPSM